MSGGLPVQQCSIEEAEIRYSPCRLSTSCLRNEPPWRRRANRVGGNLRLRHDDLIIDASHAGVVKFGSSTRICDCRTEAHCVTKRRQGMTAWSWRRSDLKSHALFASAALRFGAAVKSMFNAHNCGNDVVASQRRGNLGLQGMRHYNVGSGETGGAGHFLPDASRSTRRLFSTAIIDSHKRILASLS
jgi:hypothetical protein